MNRRIKRILRLDTGRADRIEAELDEEIRFHLEERVRELVAAGMSRENAEALALARFGPYDSARAELLEAARYREETLSMLDRIEALRYDFVYAVRQLVRAPGLSIAILTTFALGIGANAAMFGVVDRLLLRPPAFVRNPEQIATIVAGTAERGFHQRTLNYPVFRAIRDYGRGFEGVVAVHDLTLPLDRGDNARNVHSLLVSGNYFTMLGVTPRLGRFFRADEDVEPLGAPVVVLSHDFWMRQFLGSERAVGATLTLGDRQFTVVGVAPKGFTGLDLAAPDLWVPITSAAVLGWGSSNWATSGAGSWLRIVARIRPGVAPPQAAADAMRLAREAAPNAFFTRSGWAFSTNSIAEAREAQTGASANVVALLAGMSTIVLLIACANVANLLLARGLRRRREIAVRLALGVSRRRLLGQLLTEVALLALVGGGASLLVAYWADGAMRQLFFADLSLAGSAIDARILTFAALATVATAVLAGLIPALQTSRPELTSALKTLPGDGGVRRAGTRAALLVFQTAMSLVLVVGAGLFVRSITNLDAMRLGVDPDRVILGSMDLRSVGRTGADADLVFRNALERVRRVPGVSHAALASTVPFGPSSGIALTIPGRDSTIHTSAMRHVVTADYFAALDTRILAGRDFRPSDGGVSAPAIIVNHIFASRYWGSASPIGRCVHLGSDTAPCSEVIAVVENVRRQSIFEDSTMAVYIAAAPTSRGVGLRRIVARIDDRYSGSAGQVLAGVRQAIQTAGEGLPFAEVHLVADDPTVRQELRPFRLGVTMFGIFGALALVLAAVGTYGVVSYSVAQRTHEMGVRIALGARAFDILGLVMRHGVGLATIGIALGAGLAGLGGRFIGPLLFQVSPRDPLVGVLGILILLGVATAASLVPAIRAVRVDALIALRAE